MSPAEARDQVRALIEKRTILLELATNVLATRVEKLHGDQRELANVLWVMMRGISTSMRSLLTLTSSFDYRIRDCFGIARSIFEASVNVAYIAAAGPEAAHRARRHAMQKSYRDLQRSDPPELRMPPRPIIPAAAEIPGMVDALSEFTGKKGAELNDWAALSVPQKVAAIVGRYPGVQLTMSVSMDVIYRTASEILHGTFYGVEFFWEPARDDNGGQIPFEERYVYSWLMKLFTATTASVSGMLEVIAEAQSIDGLTEQLAIQMKEELELIGSPEQLASRPTE